MKGELSRCARLESSPKTRSPAALGRVERCWKRPWEGLRRGTAGKEIVDGVAVGEEQAGDEIRDRPEVRSRFPATGRKTFGPTEVIGHGKNEGSGNFLGSLLKVASFTLKNLN